MRVRGRVTGRNEARGFGLVSYVLAVAGLALPFALAEIHRLPPWLAPCMVGLSALCFLVYGWDKVAAGRGDGRVPEDLLHLFALAGGWPGGLIAQEAFRHKTVKTSFRRVFWLTVLVNLGALAWLASSQGQAVLARFH
jgi:uncharacterized membrane protein YsdA (DUF1294 family)